MERSQLTLILTEIATFMDLLGENPFKVRAYQNGARAIETFHGDLEAAVRDGSVAEIKGIGPALKEKIEEFFKTGKIKEHEALKRKIPAGVIEMLKIPGLGPKKVRTLHTILKIQNIGELEYACRENRLLKLEGFGEKTQDKILKGLEFFKRYQKSHLISDALFESQILTGALKTVKGVKKIEVAGSIRRRKEIINDIDIVVAATDPALVTKKFVSLPSVASVTGSGPTKTSVILKSGIACDLRVVTDEEFPFALLYFTGSKEHNMALRGLAKDRRLKLNEYGLFKNENSLHCRGEKEIFEKLGLAYIEPELRENGGEIEAAAHQRLPKLVERSQVRGIFHCHTIDSDGANSLEEMVLAAQNLGFEYIGISDHSASSAVYANGMAGSRVLEQFDRIDALQKKFKIRIFKGIESDILADGRLDYEDALLKKFDFVIGSIHAGFSISADKMTKRVLAAMKNPYMDFLGHPTGRLLLAREAFQIDLHAVIDEASKLGVAVEVNGNPQRLDLDWRYGRYLKEKKGLVSINPDAHSIAGLEDVDYGVSIARKAWLSPENVLNTLPANKILGGLRRARSHGA